MLGPLMHALTSACLALARSDTELLCLPCCPFHAPMLSTFANVQSWALPCATGPSIAERTLLPLLSLTPFLFVPFSKNEVINLLESAGFSRSNPYYIVQQGKVRARVDTRLLLNSCMHTPQPLCVCLCCLAFCLLAALLKSQAYISALRCQAASPSFSIQRNI